MRVAMAKGFDQFRDVKVVGFCSDGGLIRPATNSNFSKHYPRVHLLGHQRHKTWPFVVFPVIT